MVVVGGGVVVVVLVYKRREVVELVWQELSLVSFVLQFRVINWGLRKFEYLGGGLLDWELVMDSLCSLD